jgi:hypothetical protein
MKTPYLLNKFELKTSAQLKALYLDALVEQGQAAPIPGRSARTGNDGPPSKNIHVNKRGSLVIPRELVDEMGFKLEDVFTVRKSKSGISLKKTS